MPTFDELARLGNCPVIHSQRSDQAILIATRVPIDDIRLERWGWVLTLIPQDGRTDQNDIETLRDSAGGQFPKVYLHKDMQNYSERWSCTEWQEGYQQNGHQALNGHGTSSASGILQEDVLKQLVSQLQESQALEVAALKDELKAQLEATRSGIERDNAAFYNMLQNESIDSYNKILDRTRVNGEVIGQEVVTQAVKFSEVVEAQSRTARDEAGKDVQALTEEIKNQVSFSEKRTLDAIGAQFLLSREQAATHFEKEYEGIKTDLAGFATELKELQEQIKVALTALDPELEGDLDPTQTADTTSSATKIARKVTTQIERITLGHQKMSMSYFTSANEQSRQAFRYAWFLGYVAIGLLVFFVLATVLMAFLQLYGYAVLLGSLGGLGTAIVTAMGVISSSHAKTTQQFALAQKLLDRSYRPTIANAILIGYSDESHKHAALDKIIDNLLTNEAVDKI